MTEQSGLQAQRLANDCNGEDVDHQRDDEQDDDKKAKKHPFALAMIMIFAFDSPLIVLFCECRLSLHFKHVFCNIVAIFVDQTCAVATVSDYLDALAHSILFGLFPVFNMAKICLFIAGVLCRSRHLIRFSDHIMARNFMGITLVVLIVQYFGEFCADVLSSDHPNFSIWTALISGCCFLYYTFALLYQLLAIVGIMRMTKERIEHYH